MSISLSDDIIDSRDIIARIDELESYEPEELPDVEEWDDELADWKALAAEFEGYGDWEHGETIIADDYFQKYAEQLADDIGACGPQAAWPNNHIDWEAAANELKHDYMSAEVGGQLFFMRA